MQCEIRHYEDEKRISKELHESERQEVVTCRDDVSKDLESPCSVDVSYGEVKIEKTDDSCSDKKITTSLSSFMKTNDLEVQEELSTVTT